MYPACNHRFPGPLAPRVLDFGIEPLDFRFKGRPDCCDPGLKVRRESCGIRLESCDFGLRVRNRSFETPCKFDDLIFDCWFVASPEGAIDVVAVAHQATGGVWVQEQALAPRFLARVAGSAK